MNSGKSVESVLEEEKEGYRGKDLQKRNVLSQNESRVMGDE